MGIPSDPTKWLYPEIALTPNAAFFFNSDPANSTNVNQDLWGARYLLPTPNGPLYLPLNPTSSSIVGVPPVSPINLRPLLWKYQTFSGPGDADESYDAADAQNMFLALQTVTPRARGRVVHGKADAPVSYELDSNEIIDANGNYANTSNFLRLDLEDLPWPSFHRPDLENYWFHRLVNYTMAIDNASADDAVRAVLTPYGTDNIRNNVAADPTEPSGVSLDVRDEIVAMKRKISLRPLREDHPGFDGSNSASRMPRLDESAGLMRNGNIAIPFWEATGPWDVDNDNDGVPDSVWVDLGDPVQQAEDGTLYKPLYAMLIVDLDSRLNVNAHGLVDHMRRDVDNATISPRLDSTINLATNAGFGNLSHDVSLTLAGMPSLNSSNFLPAGSGYGPAEISLRPLLSPNLPGNTDVVLAGRVGNPAFDDYARLLVGRPALAGVPSVWGRQGSVDIRGNVSTWTLADWQINLSASREAIKVRPGIPYDVTSTATQAATLDRLTAFKFFGYPLWLSNYFGSLATPSSFGQVPDLLGRYAIGLDYTGQVASEPRGDSIYVTYIGDPDLSLLYDTPYELDLSDARRRDTPDPGVASTISVLKTAALDDDAPFATAELEHILRAHDADAGILPDRLWNLVDAFDPLKLRANQPALVNSRARATFGSNPGEAELLATAQQLAGVNRRLVTTDSYDVPVPGANLLARLAYGADGQPGRATIDDDGDGKPDDVGNPADNDKGELGWQNSDDWYAVMYRGQTSYFNSDGSPNPPAGVRLTPQNPTLVDLLKYRIQFERWHQNAPNFTDDQLSQAVTYLLPPEVIAGKRMDLNRPFGDGRDNGDGIDNDNNGLIDDPAEMTYPIGDSKRDPYLNGIVDEPEEAGEPFIDSDPDGNGPLTFNGRYDTGEQFRDLDGNGVYTPPRDRLWLGLTGEPIGFDYNHGGDYTDGRRFDLNGDGDVLDANEGILRNNGIQQRQTYARQLYCLMMLLVDENYNDSQNFFPEITGTYDLTFLDDKGNFDLFLLHQQLALDMALTKLRRNGSLTSGTDTNSTAFQTLLGNSVNEAKPWAYAWVLRKLTARKVAQWAINCVDYRDADSIMTPFEYDENPFDGWGVYYDPTQPFSPANFTALDGDVGTNENWGRDVPAPKKFNPYDFTAGNLDNDIPMAQLDGTRELATREVVWGAERPELLITETLALHDRRCTDEDDPAGFPPHHQIGSPPPTSTLNNAPDYDLDQKLKPRGSLFVELYNPWSADGEQPAELYGRVDMDPSTPAVEASPNGVQLNRLSALPDAVSGKRSPVWRMAVLYDPFNGKISNQVIDPRQPASGTFPSPVEQAAKQILTTDPDGFAIDMDRDAERFVYFTTGGDANRFNDNDLTYSLPDGVGDYQKITGPPDRYQARVNQLAVRVPPLPVRWSVSPMTGVEQPYPTARRYFVARTERWGTTANDVDVQLAPIMPGRYAVVGSSGLQLTGTGPSGVNTLGATDGNVTTRFVNPISRLLQPTGSGTDPNLYQRESLGRTRRIELWPSLNPNQQQLLIAENGGPEFVHTDVDGDGNVGPNEYINVTEFTAPSTPGPGVPSVQFVGDSDGDGNADTPVAYPCVAIPVEDLNVSEPVEGYPSLNYQRQYVTNTGQPALEAPARIKPTVDGELELADSTGRSITYDRPLDMDFELSRNGTTQNYRSIHLQRLADPSLPWNPPPYDNNGNANELHQPGLPINPYLTIDSQSVDLTAYNGATQQERDELPVVPATPELQMNMVPEDVLQGNFLGPLVPEELADAPDHVLWAYIFTLKQQTLDANGVLQAPIIPKNQWVTPASIRAQIQNTPNQIEQQLEQLYLRKQITPADDSFRASLIADRQDSLGRKWNGQWGWHLFRRVLPDDPLSGNSKKTGTFRQWMGMKSLERGSQDSVFYTARVPFSPFYKKYFDAGLLNNAPFGWTYDPSWTPRMLWQQPRPNARLFLRTSIGVVEASDLKNATSRRLQSNDNTPEEKQMRIADDDIRRNAAVWNRLRGGTGAGSNEHVVDFVLEQTLGFTNQAFTPELDRFNGQDAAAVLSVQKAGAPEVAPVRPAGPPSPRSSATNIADPNAVLMPDSTPYDIPKEILNSPKLAARYENSTGGNAEVGSLMQNLSDIINSGGPAAGLAAQDKAALRQEFFKRRQRILNSTYPWFAWANRPFTSADELMQVPACSSSQMLGKFSVISQSTRNPYDGGTIGDDGSYYDSDKDGQMTDEDGVRVTALRYAVQQMPYGHLLNFMLSSAQPATSSLNATNAVLTGAPNYYRVLDFVEVPSRYVGTQTMLSPETFNDVPGVNDNVNTFGTATGTDLTGATDPRYSLQPPFNFISRERDPGRVNLNTVTGRRTRPTSTLPAFHWSEVYDGIMHRFEKYDPVSGQMVRADGSLLNDAGNVLQLSHFGPAWRDVELSRRGYAEYVADPTVNSPIEKIAATQVVPDTFAFGLNRNFPSIFSNPFRSADAGDLVPLPNMVRPGVEATYLRGLHWQRAQEDILKTNPYASTSNLYPNMSWGLAGVDDDGNGLVDDIREAGYGVIDPDNQMDGDTLRIKTSTQALEGSGIPLFSEQVPEPAIDGERNPGMMYQPMTRLGNLVTTRSNVYAIWITVGYFEVEKAPDWNNPNATEQQNVRARFGATTTNTDPQTIRGRALYDRVYPDGYTLGEELGTDTGSTNRQRAFYIIDRTEPVGFKPGEPLNVDKMIRVRRRIE
ncbi:MAG: hypothetical protein AB7U97_14620 [Pirellulales bacterium]